MPFASFDAMGREDNILKINGLAINLGGTIIIEDVSLVVKEGEILGIVGVSGAGKTSLLNAIIGYYPVVAGSVLYNSLRKRSFVSILEKIDDFKGLFGFSAQNPSFYPELSVIENLEYFANLYNLPIDIKKQNIGRALKLVRLEEFTKIPAKNLSGGMKKRLDIACAIVHYPKILILDEPTSDMDPLLRVQIWGLIEDINKSGTTIIVASHFLSEVEHVCDRFAFLHKKRIEFIGTPSEFRNLNIKTKEVHITAKDGMYDLVLKRVMSMPFLEVKQILKKRGRIIIHSSDERNLNSALSRLMSYQNVSNIEIRNPSMDMLFRVFMEK